MKALAITFAMIALLIAATTARAGSPGPPDRRPINPSAVCWLKHHHNAPHCLK